MVTMSSLCPAGPNTENANRSFTSFRQCTQYPTRFGLKTGWERPLIPENLLKNWTSLSVANSLVPVLDLIGIFYLCLNPFVKSLNWLFHFPSTDCDSASSSSFLLKWKERCTQNEPKSSSSHVQYEINRTSADESPLIVSYTRADSAPKAHYRPPVYSKLSATWGAVAVSLPLHDVPRVMVPV